jgi:hypothetical protein
VNTVLNLQVPRNAGKFLSGCTISGSYVLVFPVGSFLLALPPTVKNKPVAKVNKKQIKVKT